MWLADTLLSAEASHSIRTESTDSVTDWANITGATGFFHILNTDAGENTEISRYASFTKNCGIVDFFPNGTQKVVDIYPKITNCNNMLVFSL